MFDDNKFLKGTRFTFHYELIITHLFLKEKGVRYIYISLWTNYNNAWEQGWRAICLIYISLWTNYNNDGCYFYTQKAKIYISLWTNYNFGVQVLLCQTHKFTFHYELIIT